MEQDLIDIVEPYVYSHIKTRILRLEQFSLLKMNSSTKVLLITSKTAAKKSGALDDVIATLKKFDAQIIQSTILIEENPSVQSVQAISELYKPQNISYVIGIGGGSALDAAKAVALGLKDNLLKNIPQEKLEHVPLILVPTTAGTGSEVTKYSILTDCSGEPVKKSIPDHIYANYIILNPKYLQSQPESTLAATVIDAASHAIEGLLSVSKAPIDLMAYESIHLSGDVLRTLFLEKTRDEEFWIKMMAASVMAGLVINYTGTSLPHACSYDLTTKFGISHGRALGLTYGAYLPLCDQDKVKRILSLMGLSSISDLDRLFKTLLLKNVEISLPDKVDIVKMAEKVVNSEKVKQHPGQVKLADVIEMFENISKK